MAVNAFRPSESDGGFIVDPEWFPTAQTDDGLLLPAVSHSGGVNAVMGDGFSPSSSSDTHGPLALDDGGFIVNWFPTETIRPMESLDDGGIMIIGGVPHGDHPSNGEPSPLRGSDLIA